MGSQCGFLDFLVILSVGKAVGNGIEGTVIGIFRDVETMAGIVGRGIGITSN